MENKHILLVLFISLLFSSSSFATTHTWLGGTGSWHVATNWNTTLVPSPGDEVIIPSGTCRIKPGRTGFAEDVLIQSGGTLKIAFSGTLITDSTTDGNAITNHGTFAVFGTCTVQGISYPAGAGVVAAVMNSTSGFLKIGNNGILSISGTSFIGINNHGTFRNNGNLTVQDFDFHGISNASIFDNKGSIDLDSPSPGALVGINNFDSFTNYDGATIDIAGVDLYGFNVVTASGHFHNYGDLELINCTTGLKNTGNIDNHSTGYIYMNNISDIGINNSLNFINEGQIQIAYSQYIGLYNDDYFETNGSFTVNGSSTGTGIYTTAAGTIINSGSLDVFDHTVGFNNLGYFSNLEEGIIFLSAPFENYFSAVNHGAWVNYTNENYTNGVGGFFANLGIIEDHYDVLPITLVNQQVIIRRLSATLQAGVPFTNPIDVASSSNFDIPSDWELSIFGGFAGTYDEPTNTFTPDVAAVGLTELVISIEMLSTGFSRNYTLKLDTPIAPFKTDDKPQFSLSQQLGEIQLYPNPTVDQVTFVKNDNEVANLIIYNINGQALKTVNCEQSNTEIEIPKQWTDGLYILNTYSNSGKKLGSQTFTIQR